MTNTAKRGPAAKTAKTAKTAKIVAPSTPAFVSAIDGLVKADKAATKAATSSIELIKQLAALGVVQDDWRGRKEDGRDVTPTRNLIMTLVADRVLTKAERPKWSLDAKGSGGGQTGKPRDEIGDIIDKVAKVVNNMAALFKKHVTKPAEETSDGTSAKEVGDAMAGSLKAHAQEVKKVRKLIDVAKADKRTAKQAADIAAFGGADNLKAILKALDTWGACLVRKPQPTKRTTRAPRAKA